MQLRSLTVREWQDETGATGEPDDAQGNPLGLDDVITLSPNGEEYCVGHPTGNEQWFRFDGAAVLGDSTGGF